MSNTYFIIFLLAHTHASCVYTIHCIRTGYWHIVYAIYKFSNEQNLKKQERFFFNFLLLNLFILIILYKRKIIKLLNYDCGFCSSISFTRSTSEWVEYNLLFLFFSLQLDIINRIWYV